MPSDKPWIKPRIEQEIEAYETEKARLEAKMALIDEFVLIELARAEIVATRMIQHCKSTRSVADATIDASLGPAPIYATQISLQKQMDNIEKSIRAIQSPPTLTAWFEQLFKDLRAWLNNQQTDLETQKQEKARVQEILIHVNIIVKQLENRQELHNACESLTEKLESAKEEKAALEEKHSLDKQRQLLASKVQSLYASLTETATSFFDKIVRRKQPADESAVDAQHYRQVAEKLFEFLNEPTEINRERLTSSLEMFSYYKKHTPEKVERFENALQEASELYAIYANPQHKPNLITQHYKDDLQSARIEPESGRSPSAGTTPSVNS